MRTRWDKTTAVPPIGPAEVHIWRARMDGEPSRFVSLCQMLSAEERLRAERFHFARDRKRYMIGRGLLRYLLGRYQCLPPAQVAIDYTPYGKPFLPGENGPQALHFNLSHSGDWLALAFARGRAVGVDIEQARREVDLAALSARFFSNGEQAVLRSLPDSSQTDAFFACWTRKEAYIKARGEGLSLPLDCFDVAFHPREAPAILANRKVSGEETRWKMEAFCPFPGYAGAVVAEGQDWQPLYLQEGM